MQAGFRIKNYGVDSETKAVVVAVMKRSLVHLGLIGIFLLAPWWLFFLVAILVMGVMSFFAEVIIYGLLIDILFAPPEPLLGFAFVTTALFLISFVLVEYVKVQVR